MTGRHGGPLLVSLLILVAVLPVAGCSGSSGVGHSSPTTGNGRHEPSTAELASLQRQLGAIDGVTMISDFSYQKSTFENGAFTDATLETSSTAKSDLDKILDTAYRITWQHSDLAIGSLIYVVRNPTTGAEAGSTDLGFTTASVGARDLQQRYGPPTASTP